MNLFGGRQTIRLRVSGMTCMNCERHVREALERVPGVKRAAVDLASGTATVEAAPSVGAGTLTAAVAAAGYAADDGVTGSAPMRAPGERDAGVP